ncbi:MAG: DUF58 domain-containing protein [candidate division WOR-3 bacterium]|uniref:DUF58 domain-containing protein n=1 Tax=candidate division WOR-3 bacterium TaxID=2052148 RepID=A0A7C3EMR2_UNCW3|nr:DUF58 domain-containing protein [candidate division WOR-3 bacterium]
MNRTAARVELSRIRQVEIRTKRLVNTIFAGDYRSSFKGRGVEFADVREYLPGDDVRTIDWSLTARFGKPFVKQFAEERELLVMLLVDASGSNRFGTRGQFKLEQAALVGATLAFSAIRNNDKVGLVFFTDRIERYVPPAKGRFHVLRLVRDILYFEPAGLGTEPVTALNFVMHILKRRAIVFLISDLLGPGFNPERIEKSLGIVSRKHDLIVISINDLAERNLPNLGVLEFEDAESGRQILVNTASVRTRRYVSEQMNSRREAMGKLFQRFGVDWVQLQTGEEFTPVLHRFFVERARRYR